MQDVDDNKTDERQSNQPTDGRTDGRTDGPIKFHRNDVASSSRLRGRSHIPADCICFRADHAESSPLKARFSATNSAPLSFSVCPVIVCLCPNIPLRSKTLHSLSRERFRGGSTNVGSSVSNSLTTFSVSNISVGHSESAALKFWISFDFELFRTQYDTQLFGLESCLIRGYANKWAYRRFH